MPRRHEVREGECIATIADQYGLFPPTIWDAPANAALRAQRKSPYVLAPGDVLTIPDVRPRRETAPTGAVHRFKRKGVPEKLSFVLADDGRPRADLPYTLEVDGRRIDGRTGADGRVEHWIPPDAKQATLVIDDDERYTIALGRLDPESSDEGALRRLENLGLLARGFRDRDSIEDAVQRFQRAQGLTASGTLDAATRDRLREAHGA